MEGVKLHRLQGETKKVNPTNVGVWSSIKSWFSFRFRFKSNYRETELVEEGVDVIPECNNIPTLEALSNSLILTETFKFLAISDLHNTRLVNRQWKEIATYVIKDKFTLCLGHWFGRFYPGKSYTDLFNCLDSSEIFPCSKIFIDWRLGSGEDKKIREDRLHVIHEKLVTDDADADENAETGLMPYLRRAGEDTYNSTQKEGTSLEVLDEQLLRFIRNHGYHIKYLSISLTFDNVETLLDLFLQQLPNLEHLSMSENWDASTLPIYKRKAIDSIKPMSLLTKLKTILYYGGNPRHDSMSTETEVADEASSIPLTCLEIILNLCPNLYEIQCFSLKMTQVVVKSRKFETVRSVYVNLGDFIPSSPHYQMNIAHLVRFSAQKPKLEAFFIWMNIVVGSTEDFTMCPAVCDALEGILKSSESSLKRLKIPAHHHFPGMKLPPSFPNLKRLRISNLRTTGDLRTYFQNSRMFPPGYITLKFGREFPFPNVKSLSLVVENMQVGTLTRDLRDNFWIKKQRNKIRNRFNSKSVTAMAKPDPAVVPFSSVTVLKFLLNKPKKEKNPKSVSVYLQMKFPNLKKVVFINYDLARMALRKEMYYLAPTVESIELTEMNPNHDDYEFDSFFLGISKQLCKKLSFVKDERLKELAWESHKTSFNIREFQHLKTLCIKFDSYDNDWLEDENSQFRRIITLLSWELGFKKMPNCQVIFMYDDQSKFALHFASVLKPIAPFVQIRSFL